MKSDLKLLLNIHPHNSNYGPASAQDGFIIMDLFTAAVNRYLTFMPPWFLHIGSMNKYMSAFIDRFTQFTGYFVNDNVREYKQMLFAYKENHHVFNFGITYNTGGRSKNYKEEKFSLLKINTGTVRPYPFRRPFSFISICKGNNSYNIMKQINLSKCFMLAIECPLSYYNPDNEKEYDFSESNRLKIFNYANKYNLTHMHTGENILIFCRL